MKESFGEKLKRARTQSGLKQSELAKTLGVKNTTISNWENNISKPDLDMLSYICGVLNVKASFFLEAHPPMEDIDCSEYEIIEKYRLISTHSPDGAVVVDTVLDREYAIAEKLREQNEKIIELADVPKYAKEETPDYLKPVAAHNEKENEEQITLMQKDIAKLKIPK